MQRFRFVSISADSNRIVYLANKRNEQFSRHGPTRQSTLHTVTATTEEQCEYKNAEKMPRVVRDQKRDPQESDFCSTFKQAWQLNLMNLRIVSPLGIWSATPGA
jgi:hypothetical protein